MNKLKEIGLIAFAGLAFMLMTTHVHVSAGILDTIKNTVTGHIQDAKSRFDKDRPEFTFEQNQVVKRGSIYEGPSGQDPIHSSEGSIAIIEKDGENYLYLGKNFDSSPGPDYHVYLSYEPKILDEQGFDNNKQIEISRLRYGNGEQFYKLPKDIDVTKIKSFLLWCKAFGAYIGSADLK